MQSSSASCSVSPLMLATWGFLNLGTGDAVECIACKTHLSGWSASDIEADFANLQEMHKQNAPQCQPVNGNARENDPLNMMNLPGIGGSGAGRGDIEADFANLDLERNNAVNSDPMSRILFAACKRASSKGVFSSSTDCEMVRLKPDYEKLRKEEVRLRTFQNWPSAAWTDPQVLALEGLFYTGTADQVQCAFCLGVMRNWEPADIPSAEHKRHFPDCPFVRGHDIGNVPIVVEPNDTRRKTDDAVRKAMIEDDGKRRRIIEVRMKGESLGVSIRTSAREQVQPVHVDPPKFPDYANASQRLNSFLRGHVSQGQTAEGLAEAGWFWIGPSDKVRCFQCGGNLRDWEPEDDPWEEHKRWYANCAYIKDHSPSPKKQFQEPVHQMVEDQQVSCESIAEQPQGTPVDALMDRKEIKTVLHIMKDFGFNTNHLRTLVEERLTRGEDCLIPKELLEAVFNMYEF